jgi:hypothetical protein
MGAMRRQRCAGLVQSHIALVLEMANPGLQHSDRQEGTAALAGLLEFQLGDNPFGVQGSPLGKHCFDCRHKTTL